MGKNKTKYVQSRKPLVIEMEDKELIDNKLFQMDKVIALENKEGMQKLLTYEELLREMNKDLKYIVKHVKKEQSTKNRLFKLIMERLLIGIAALIIGYTGIKISPELWELIKAFILV